MKTNIQNRIEDRIIVALDVPTQDQALELVSSLKSHVGLFKVGLELLTSVGTGIVKKIAELGGNVFFDGKFLDIPNTVEGACRAATRLGVRIIDVHATGGAEMMRTAVQSVADEAAKIGVDRPMVLAVTVLTSINNPIMNEELRISGDVKDQVVHLATLAKQCGLDGVIASPQEITPIRQKVGDDFIIVTPGVRPAWAAAGDQKRIMEPGQAFMDGASFVVIGRPITTPPKNIGTPVEAVARIAQEAKAAIEKTRN